MSQVRVFRSPFRTQPRATFLPRRGQGPLCNTLQAISTILRHITLLLWSLQNSQSVRLVLCVTWKQRRNRWLVKSLLDVEITCWSMGCRAFGVGRTGTFVSLNASRMSFSRLSALSRVRRVYGGKVFSWRDFLTSGSQIQVHPLYKEQPGNPRPWVCPPHKLQCFSFRILCGLKGLGFPNDIRAAA